MNEMIMIDYKKLMSVMILSLVFYVSCQDDDEAGMVVTVTAIAGMDQFVEPMDMVTLDGSASSVTGGGILIYNWEFNSIPAGSTTSLDGATTANASFTADLAGDYVLTLTVSSGSETDEDMITVSAVEPQFSQSDQMARPAINTVFVPTNMKDAFNTTIPADMGAMFAAAFETRLLALNPDYTVNALGWNAATMAGALATDVLNSDLTSPTAFGTLNGRALTDDVVTTELTLIFGGPTGQDKPNLNDDNVDANDKAFLEVFPYLAEPH